MSRDLERRPEFNPGDKVKFEYTRAYRGDTGTVVADWGIVVTVRVDPRVGRVERVRDFHPSCVVPV